MKRGSSVVAVVLLSLLWFGLPGLAQGPKVTLRYESIGQAELTSPEGVRVYLDVFHPADLFSSPTPRDVLLTTHLHEDHFDYYGRFDEDFPGVRLTAAPGEIRAGDVKVTSVLSRHMFGWDVKNYIMVVELGGLRVVHFGDIGQDALTPEQLAAVGRVDIAFMEFIEEHLALMEQLRPRLVIPTHFKDAPAEKAFARWPSFRTGYTLRIGPEDLGEGTRFLVMGENATPSKLWVDLPVLDRSLRLKRGGTRPLP